MAESIKVYLDNCVFNRPFDNQDKLNPFVERKEAIGLWKKYAILDIEETDKLLKYAERIIDMGIKSKDALHIASAIIAEANYFITTDKEILQKASSLSNLICSNPVNFIDVLEDLKK
jgi:predicted nucleic acid-binding protein